MSYASRILHAVFLAGLGFSLCAVAQQPLLLADIPEASSPDNSPNNSPAPAEVTAAQKPATPAQPAVWEQKIDRWADFSAATFSFRYRDQTAVDDYRYFANGQQRYILDGRLKLDAAARYTINYHLSSGRVFNWSYSDEIGDDFQTRNSIASLLATPPALQIKLFTAIAEGNPVPPSPSRGWELGARLLYASATPIDELTLEYGSLGIERGQGSEITTYDDDGYLTGERVRFHDPKHLYFDQIAVTYAFEGDYFQPNFIDRTQHLLRNNYHQFLIEKHFGSHMTASADYTCDQGPHTVREAVFATVPGTKVLDSVRAEFYERVNTHYVGPYPFAGGAGFGLTGAKTLYKKFTLDGGYEQVDLNYGANELLVLPALVGFTLNGDSYNTGKHVFTHGSLKLTPYTNLTGFYIHQTAPVPSDKFSFVKEGWNVGMTFDLKKMVGRAQQVF